MKETRRKKKLGGYPAMGVIISITLSLFVIGLFGLLIIYSQELEHQVRQNIRMQVYLNSTITETQRLQIENKLLSIKYINKEAENALTFIPKEEAAKKFIAGTGEDFSFLGYNPLRDAYLIRIDPAHHTITEMDNVKAEIQKMNGVFQVVYEDKIINNVNKNVTQIGLILVGLIVILLLTVIVLINNTLRLALFSQRFLIRSMQLVGAKDWFIQRPFLFRATGYGILSGVIASLLLLSFTKFLNKKIPDIAILQNEQQLMILMILLVTAGIIIGVLSTLFTMQKYLRMSLDELY